MRKEKAAVFEMLACAAMWSIGGIFIKLIPWNSFVIASLRSLISGITIFICMKLMGIKYVLNRKSLIIGFFSGLTYVAFVCANKLTTAANAIVMQYTSPVFTLLISRFFFRKRFKRADAAVVVLTLAGVALCFLDQMSAGNILGNFVGIITGMFMAAMFVLVGEAETGERFSGIVNGQALTFLIGLPFIAATNPEFSASSIIAVLILGVVQLGISNVLYLKSSRYCPPLACCLLGALEPLLNPVWVMLFDGETPGIPAIAGGLIVILSITGWCVISGPYQQGKNDSVSEA